MPPGHTRVWREVGVPAHRLRAKYARLLAWLAALPDGRREARLRLGEIAALVGDLPQRAATATFWSSGSTPRNNWRAVGFRARLDARNGGSVLFIRQPNGPGPRPPAPSRYAPLCALLAALPAGESQVTFSFAEIEALTGRRLPAGAWRSAFWRSSQTARLHWQRYGFQAQASYRDGARVTFTRSAAGASTSRFATA